MKNVGIVHYSNDSLINFLTVNNNKMRIWWESKEVKQVVNEIKNKYARSLKFPELALAKKLISFAD